MAITANRPSFAFAETTPDTVCDLQPQREFEALLAYGTPGAHRFRVAHRLAAGRKEVDLAGVVHALRVLLPRGRDIVIGKAGVGQVEIETRSH